MGGIKENHGVYSRSPCHSLPSNQGLGSTSREILDGKDLSLYSKDSSIKEIME